MKVEEKAHAVYSASGSKRWLNCPGSISLSKHAPPQFESKYAAEGTKAHACLEEMLRKGNTQAVRKQLLKTYDGAMVGNAEMAFSCIEQLKPRPDAELLVETKVDFSFIEPDQFGTLDAAWVEEFGTLVVIDYKYGQGVEVGAEYNTQMIYYALCLANKYDFNFETVKLVIIQPRVDNPVRIHNMTMAELKVWAGVFKSGVANTKEKNPKLVTGDHCKWCPATTICPEVSKKQMALARIDFNEVNGELDLPDTKTIGVPHLGQTLQAAERIEFWISELRAHAEQLLNRGHKIAGWKLVEKRGTRKWLDIEKATKEAVKTFGKQALSEPELLSPAQFEKTFKGGKGAAEWLAKRVSNVSSGTTLVAESDPRPAVVKAKDDFDLIETDNQKPVSKGWKK